MKTATYNMQRSW